MAIPANAIESLAILYLQNLDLSDKSPEELYHLYVETYDKIKAVHEENAKCPESSKTEVFKRTF